VRDTFSRTRFLLDSDNLPVSDLTNIAIPAADHGMGDRLRRFLPLVAFALCLLDGLYVKDMIARTPDNDFAKVYFSTVAFVRGGEMYGINPSTPSGEVDGKTLHLWDLNPPHFHLIILPFTLLPIYPALLLWCVLNLFCFALSLHAIRRELRLTAEQEQLALVGVLTFAGTTTALLSGHCSFLLMFVVTRMWLAARHDRWTNAGLYLGLAMSVKPFLLMVLPYLLLRRRWRAAGAALAVILLCFVLGMVVFGVDNHVAWRAKLGDSTGWCWQFLNGSLYGLLARLLTANPMGQCLVDGPQALVPLLWLGLGVPIGLATLAMSYVEKTSADVDRSFGILLVASLLLSPLGWSYYLCLPLGPTAAVAVSWLRSAGASSRWSRGLFLAAACGLVLPFPVLRLFQPSALATVLLGNLYSYCLLAIWTALFLDGRRALRANRSPDTRFLRVL
jgi:hypothetical protein